MSDNLNAEAQSPILVSTEWLADNLESSEFVLIDAGEFVAYRRAHIPGAIGLPHPYLKGRGSKLVMGSDQFEDLASSWGLSNDQPVVIYDDNASLHAARMWWVLRYFGHKNVKVVDGGLNAWLAENKPLTSKIPRPERSEFHSEIDTAQVCDINELKSLVGTGAQIWDTRSDEEWNGTESRGNARVGRIPGSIHFEWRHLLEGPPFRRFRPLSEIRTTLVEAGIDVDAPVVSYCQAGIRGAFGQFVLALLGNMESRNYDGSMDEWANEEDTPLEV